jgi:probable addiction module antidote protein
MALKTTVFDAAEYLDTPEAQAEFVTAAVETGDAAFIRDAVNTVARARDIGEIAGSMRLGKSPK